MEVLHSLVVTALVAAHVFSPNANPAKVLGTRIAENSTDVETEVEVDTSEDDSTQLRTTTRSELKDRLEERKMELEQERENKREEIQTRIQQAASASAQRREEFQNHLQEIRDERKQSIVENIDTRLSSVNEKWVTHWNNVLSRLSEILVKLQTRLDEYAGDADTTALSSAITQAQTSINTAQAAVTAQAGKTYTIDITDETTLGDDVSSTISDFHSDIQEVLDTVKAAREDVHNVFVEVRKLTNLGNTTDETQQ